MGADAARPTARRKRDSSPRKAPELDAKNALVFGKSPKRGAFFAFCLTNYFLTISAFSSMVTPPLLAILPFKVTVLPASGASSSFIGLCAPTTR